MSGAMALGERLETRVKIGRWHEVAALALNGLDEDRRNLIGWDGAPEESFNLAEARVDADTAIRIRILDV
jgi:hypothetical protein